MGKTVVCPTCHGNRIVIRKVGRNKVEMDCPTCWGTGVVPLQD